MVSKLYRKKHSIQKTFAGWKNGKLFGCLEYELFKKEIRRKNNRSFKSAS